MKKFKVILCGYHHVGAEVLNHLLDRDDIADVALFTHEPKGNLPDLTQIAKSGDVWHSTKNISNSELPFKPDIISSVYYRNIIKPHVIEGVEGRIFNLHPSLLPRHKGCSSIPWSIIENDSVTGITFHYIDEGIDTGNIILQSTIKIAPDETSETLFQRAMDRGAQFWPHAFELVKQGFPGVSQEGEGNYHKREVPYNGIIDDAWDDGKIERFIRAMNYPPLPYAKYNGEEIETFEKFKLKRGK